MSLLDKKTTKKLRLTKKEKREKEIIRRAGVEIIGTPTLEQNKKKYFVFANALINFLVVIGTIGTFIEPFKIKCYMPIVIIFGGIISIVLAFFYYNSIIKIIGYIVCLITFIYCAYNYRYLLKGGFGYISNILMKFFEKELDLPIERTYDVYGYTEKIAVTICLLFIAFSIMLLFNMVISESKGFVIVFIVTFIIVQIPMYFNQNISMPYFSMYIIGLFGLFFLRNSKHFHMEYKGRKGYKKRNKKNKVVFDYTNDGKHSLSFVLVLGAIIFAVTILANVAFPQNKFKVNDKYSQWKDSTTDFTKKLIMVGFWGMINENGGSAGGVGRSRLGQSKFIKLDYQTDLTVTMPIQDYQDSLYLKFFTGSYYNDEYWETISEQKKNDVNLEDYDLSAEDVFALNGDMMEVFKYYNNSELLKGSVLKLVNVAANTSNYYIPYNFSKSRAINKTIVNDDEINGELKQNWYHIIYFYPFKSYDYISSLINELNLLYQTSLTKINENETLYGKSIIEKEEKYSEYVHNKYLEVPKENKKVIKEFCEKYELNSESKDIVDRVAQIFSEDYEYTLMPGVTPSNKEFVNYFLTEQKKGYCTYFATSATLIFRYLGIPARYASGYVLFSSDLKSGNLSNDNVSEYKSINDESYDEIYEYELNDSQAHAWVEIYVDGFGWIPVETTPASEDEEVIEEPPKNGFVNFITNTVLTKSTYNKVKKTTTNIIYFIILFLLVFIMAYITMGIIIRKRRYYEKDIEKKYKYLCRITSFYKIIKDKSESYEDYGNRLINAELIETKKMEALNQYIEKNKFSGEKLYEDQVDFVNKTIISIENEVYSRLKWYKKFIFRYIKWL